MSTSEKYYIIFLLIIVVLKALAFVPGIFDKDQAATEFSAWLKSQDSTPLRYSIWYWLNSAVGDMYLPFFVLFVLTATSLLVSLLSFIPMFARTAATLVFFTFLSALITATVTSVYFFYLVSSKNYTMTEYNYFGVGMYLFMASEAIEFVLLVTSVFVYNHRNSETKWGRF